eukprot:scaffold14232_cov69-Phaeocystis_antarctica.AAC.2
MPQCARPRGTAARHGSNSSICSLFISRRWRPRTAAHRVRSSGLHFTLFMHARRARRSFGRPLVISTTGSGPPPGRALPLSPCRAPRCCSKVARVAADSEGVHHVHVRPLYRQPLSLQEAELLSHQVHRRRLGFGGPPSVRHRQEDSQRGQPPLPHVTRLQRLARQGAQHAHAVKAEGVAQVGSPCGAHAAGLRIRHRDLVAGCDFMHGVHGLFSEGLVPGDVGIGSARMVDPAGVRKHRALRAPVRTLDGLVPAPGQLGRVRLRGSGFGIAVHGVRIRAPHALRSLLRAVQQLALAECIEGGALGGWQAVHCSRDQPRVMRPVGVLDVSRQRALRHNALTASDCASRDDAIPLAGERSHMPALRSREDPLRPPLHHQLLA